MTPKIITLTAILFIATLGASVQAAPRVKWVARSQDKVTISHSKRRRWQEGDSVCLYRKRKKVACGTVVKISRKRALVEISARKGKVRKRLRAKRVSEEVLSAFAEGPELLDRAMVDGEESGAGSGAGSVSAAKWDVTLGANFGLKHLFPFLHLQRAITPKFSLGAFPLYLRGAADTDTLTGIGGFLTANYYSLGNFRGLWVQAAAGGYQFTASTATQEESLNSIAGQLTVGWREHWPSGFNVAAGVGLQYLTDPEITILISEFKDLQATATIEFGLTF